MKMNISDERVIILSDCARPSNDRGSLDQQIKSRSADWTKGSIFDDIIDHGSNEKCTPR